MRRPFVHCADLVLEAGSDSNAPGGAVTLALCGSWDHAGACRWPHITSAGVDERRIALRVVFVADEEEEKRVRTLIGEAVAGGECAGPDGVISKWSVTGSSAGVLSASEESLGAELVEKSAGNSGVG